jgi:nicotinamidase-related amidase
MNQSKKALLVIDIQNDFTAENAKMPVNKLQGDKMMANINQLIDDSVNQNMTIIYIGNEYGLFNPLNIFRNFAAIKNTEGTKLDARLHVINEHYFSKAKGNAFSNPDLEYFLKSEQINEIYIGGLYADHCILATAKGAQKLQYNVTILTDCIATKSNEKLSDSIEKFKKLGVKLSTSVQL